MNSGFGRIWGALGFWLVLTGIPVHSGQKAANRLVVKIQDEKPLDEAESNLPVDPVARIRLFKSGGINLRVNEELGRNLHLSHFPCFLIDGQFINPNNGMVRFEQIDVPLPKTAAGKDRNGFMNVFSHGDLQFFQMAEVTATRSPGPGQNRRLDSVLIRYLVENKGKQTHQVGIRVYLDTYVIDNTGCLFAAPTLPDKLLDGIDLKDKILPDYLQVLQRPDLKNPGFIAHLTLNLGSSVEKATRVVLTRHGIAFNAWDMMPIPSMGNSALGIFWDPKEIKAGSKREVAYAYGQGIALPPEGEGRFHMDLAGSFEPGSDFTITATVTDPRPGQFLRLELPGGMERIEGREIQPVPAVQGEGTQSLVLWKARVLNIGNFPLRIHSSTGLTQIKIIHIAREG